jgi:hypothetical protein
MSVARIGVPFDDELIGSAGHRLASLTSSGVLV